MGTAMRSMHIAMGMAMTMGTVMGRATVAMDTAMEQMRGMVIVIDKKRRKQHPVLLRRKSCKVSRTYIFSLWAVD